MKLQNVIWSLKQKTSKNKASQLLVKVLVRLVKNLHRNFVYLMLKVGRSIYTYVHVLLQKYEDSLIQGRRIIYFLYDFIQICFSGFTIHCITQYLLKCTCSSTCQSFRMTGCRRMSILDASFVNVTVLHSFHWLFISLSLIVRKNWMNLWRKKQVLSLYFHFWYLLYMPLKASGLKGSILNNYFLNSGFSTQIYRSDDKPIYLHVVVHCKNYHL